MIGEIIRLFRQEKGIGVVEFSKKLGINRISLFRIENGQRQPSERTAVDALKTLGLSEENIYHIFVFNDLLRRETISKRVRDNEVRSFLKRLKKRDKEGTILSRYFHRILKAN